jgi:hypothetical protein
MYYVSGIESGAFFGSPFHGACRMGPLHKIAHKMLVKKKLWNCKKHLIDKF